MKNWTIIHISPLNRVNTILFIFQKKSFLYLNRKKNIRVRDRANLI